MMRTVTVRLTPAEAKALGWLAGDLMSDADELRNRIGLRDFNTCCRAVEKLNAAMRRPTKRDANEA